MLFRTERSGPFDSRKAIIPKEGEIRLIANKNKECKYFFIGIDKCREKIMALAADPASASQVFGFLPCKKLVDAHFKCMTDELYGETVEDAPEEIQGHADRFYDCAFKKLRDLRVCQGDFDAMVRQLYRSPDTLLKDY